MGIGFPHNQDIKEWDSSHLFFRGNHDNPSVCKSHPNYIGDYGYKDGIFWVCGAHSVDAEDRIPGMSWWADEVLSNDDLEDAYMLYMDNKPEIVITHEAPWMLHKALAALSRAIDPSTYCFGEPKPYSTALIFEDMFKAHKPKVWCHGHWHIDFSVKIHGTQFICLNELECIKV